MNTERGTDLSQRKLTYRTATEGEYPDELVLELVREIKPKYMENPGQNGAIYVLNKINAEKIIKIIGMRPARTDDKGKGGLSLTNMLDAGHAANVLKFHSEQAVAIMKHNIVSGFAKPIDGSIVSTADVFRVARDADILSNFGGTAAINGMLDMETARAMYELKGTSPFFVDVIVAQDFDKGVIDFIQEQSKNVRIVQFDGLRDLPKFEGDDTHGLVSFKEVPFGRIAVQDIYLTKIRGTDDLIYDAMIIDKDGNKHVVERDPTQREANNLLTALYLNIAGARSNGITVVNHFNGIARSVAMGSGKVARSKAVLDAIMHGMQDAMRAEGISFDPLMGIAGYEKLSRNPFKGSSLSSDAFLPFRDSVDLANRVGIKTIGHPYGSERDAESIDAVNEYSMSMPATDRRCFGHW